MKKIFCFSITALMIVSAPAQINKPGLQDVDFVQVDATRGYTASITPDGILHYKAPAKPVAAAVIFQDPVSGTYPNVDFNFKKIRRAYAVKEEKSGGYIIDISKENYNEKYAVTLILTTAKGDSAAVILGNRNVKAEYVQYDKSNYGHHLQQEASRESRSTFKQWKDATQHYYIRTVTGSLATPGGPQTHISVVNNKGETLKGSGIGTAIKLSAEGAEDFWRVLDSLVARLDNCKDCPTVRKPAEMDSISLAAEKFVRIGITYHMPMAGKPAYYLYSKDEYGILRLIERRFSRGCSVTEYDNDRVDAFLNVLERYEKNGAEITKVLEEGTLVIKSADKDFLPQVKRATEKTLACTVWIDTAGLVHCKTANPLISAEIFFYPPTATITENGRTHTIFTKEQTKSFIPKKNYKQEYTMDITKENYKQKNLIKVILYDKNGKNATAYLLNKRRQTGK